MVGFLERSDLCNTLFPRLIHGDLFLFSTERDAFDTLFDHAPDKLSVVKKVLRLCSSIVLCGTMEDYGIFTKKSKYSTVQVSSHPFIFSIFLAKW